MKTPSTILCLATLLSSALGVAAASAAASPLAPSDSAHVLCDGDKHEEDTSKSDSKKTEKKEEKSDKKAPSST